MMLPKRFAALALLCLTGVANVFGDTFAYFNEDGQDIVVDARLVASAKGVHLLETDDGQYRMIPQGAVRTRKPNDLPEPIEPATMVKRLTEQFGEDHFYGMADGHYVVGLVLAAPLESRDTARSRAFVKKMTTFMKRVDSVFMRFAREMRFPTEPPTHPLVTLVFETDRDFNEYASMATGGRGLTATNLAGFYSPLTNFLAIRLRECDTFETPLHEAIHQQVFNRHIFQRFAPVPKWFNEGIATGFEGNGERINIGPMKINSRYARQVANTGRLPWATVVSNDGTFGADVLAGEAYTHAWSIHWMLVTKFKTEYMNYVKLLGKKQPLSQENGEDRLDEFAHAFGKPVNVVQAEFRNTLQAGIKRQKITMNRRSRAGVSRERINLGEVEIKATKNSFSHRRTTARRRSTKKHLPNSNHVVSGHGSHRHRPVRAVVRAQSFRQQVGRTSHQTCHQRQTRCTAIWFIQYIRH